MGHIAWAHFCPCISISTCSSLHDKGNKCFHMIIIVLSASDVYIMSVQLGQIDKLASVKRVFQVDIFNISVTLQLEVTDF